MSLKIRCTDKNCGVCNPRVVPILLPPEPPHDRVIEAVSQDGTVVERWAWDGQYWVEAEVGDRAPWAPWWSIAAGAMRQKWDLRHVAAEEAS